VNKVLAALLTVFFAFTAEGQSPPPYKILVFSATAGFRHDSITNGIATIQGLGSTNGFTVDATENATAFTDANLAQYRAVVFLNTTGDVLTNTAQESALQNFIRAGGGWVGIHSAGDTEYGWAWYAGLLGAYFGSHSTVQAATVKVIDPVDPSTSMLPRRWVRTDEWYNFQTNPRSSVHVLATLDESTYSGGTNGYDHPIAWSHNYDGGRAWYTAGGHTPESFSEPLFLAHLLGGIKYAAGVAAADPGSTMDSNYQKVILDNNVSNPLQLSVAPDRRVFYIERGGNVKMYNPTNSLITLVGHLDAEQQVEDGLLGITLDNGFTTNRFIYFFYSPNTTNSAQSISRFTLSTSNTLDMTSEKVLLTIGVTRGIGNHSGGCLFMHTNGDLYISAGDNTDPFSSSGFAPLDERAGRAAYDSEKSASNENDLRGKILRIHPQPDGTYTIPSGNLFPPGTLNTRPEIYVMGCRNPFRFTVDEATGWVYWGEVGPDANTDSPTRGPKGYDEWNQARGPGNFGWPYFLGNNKPYIDYDFNTGLSGSAFNPAAPTNDSPNNTGPTSLPPAQPAWLWYPYDSSPEFPELDGSGGRTAMGGPVYHYKTNVVNAKKLPAYYDNTLFIWEWSRNYIKEVKMDESGNVLKISPFLPSFAFKRPIDLKIGPDGCIYLIEWGTGYNGSNPDARLVRIEYTGGSHSPVAMAKGTPDSGLAPLTVQFSSAGTYDPDTNDVVSLAWSFFGDGTTNSTAASPSFTYTNTGYYQAQLTVRDLLGNQSVADVPIVVGNTRPVVTILQPPNGAIFDWGKGLAYQVSVFDAQDGSTTNGTIGCSNLIIAPLLGHNDHAHGQGVYNACSGTVVAPVNTDSDADNLFFVLNASYTDRGAPGVSTLIGSSTFTFPPRHKQAEFCTTNSGVTTALTGDVDGGLDITNISHGSFIGLYPVNLTNINGITYRVASTGLGGRIEARLDSASGVLLASANVPFTAGVYTNITAPLTDPGGTHTLFFVFVRNPGDQNLFVLNWMEFQGPGVGIGSTAFNGTTRSLPGQAQAEDFDQGGEGVAYSDQDPANRGGQYRAEGVDIETTTDAGAGYDVGFVQAGEWLNYSVNVTTPGVYTFSLRVASGNGGGTIHIEFGGVDKTGAITVPNTGGWQSWQTVSVPNVVLDAGPQIMRVVMDSNATGGGDIGNFNWFQAVLTLSNSPPTVALTAPPAQAVFSTDTLIQFAATASDPGGSVAKVDYFENGNLLATASNAPYKFIWTNPPAGNYLISARATDNVGNSSLSQSRTIKVIAGKAPFYGLPQVVPGTIQAEDFDGGGEGVAYHDADTSNNGNQYRATGVDVENCSDTGTGYNIGWTTAGEWLSYTLNAAVDGLYTLQIRAASSGNGGAFHVEIDGVNKTGAVTNLDSGGWQTWRNLTKTIGMTGGLHTMKLVFESNGANGTVGNYNYFTFSATATNLPPVLAHRYSFEGAASSTFVADSIGTAHGTLQGGGAFTGDGKLNLLGVNGFVDLPNGIISGLSNVTMEAWLTWNGGAQWQRIFDFGSNSGGENAQGTGLTYLALTSRSGGNVMHFAVTTNSGGGEIPADAAQMLPVGQPVHVAVSYDFLAGTSRLFLNGQSIGTGAASIPLNRINDVNVWLGKSQWNDPYFSGQFDEFRIYNGALSEQQVDASYVAGPDALFGPNPGLTAQLSGASLKLLWPLSAPGFVLEQAGGINASPSWTAVTNAPLLQNGQHIVTLPVSNSMQFFRLRK
jgi:glucose/arabinose dehydrogenase/type 1 glutamine amidotransferase